MLCGLEGGYHLQSYTASLSQEPQISYDYVVYSQSACKYHEDDYCVKTCHYNFVKLNYIKIVVQMR